MIYKYSNISWVGLRTSLIVLIAFSSFFCFGQKSQASHFFQKSDTLNRSRVAFISSLTAVNYTAFSVGFYQLWYKQHDQEPFHFFNDWEEWRKVDKLGHFYSSYFQADAAYKAAKWMGMKDNASIYSGMILSSVVQTTIEVMDGFSSKWGFSVPDIAFNVGGVSAFALQQKIWQEQRILFKVSSIPVKYPTDIVYSVDGSATSSLSARAKSLYGDGYFQSFLKDYNAQNIWMSINIKSFLPADSNFPSWLNLAIGYSAENMYGGFQNTWEEQGTFFALDAKAYPRYSQFFISPDIDLSRIRTKSYFFNTLFDVFNVFRMPLPSLEINTLGEFHFHLFR